ncbi:MHYT domain-containing protein [Thermocoleostomius sinensis]|uniref:Signal protein n=1 Tax=Thermocoleostomius sinensis A174 TaxID=2016057 RepID=A0A9E8ZG25_9CYAN|nr:MHYT domain-containing protein [Thermocoleostomius sinensis]WAL61184.1 signal protein [Thermocoleostomius sinensis A174]
MSGTYNFSLVIVSALIAIVSAYIALEVARRLLHSRQDQQQIWLFGGGAVMGTGIWAMHFIAMLAFNIPLYVSYNLPLVFLSLILAIGAATQAFYIVSRRHSPISLLTGSIIMGIGIALMHYTGMAAMHMPASLQYQPILFAVSILVAISVSYVALQLTRRFQDEQRSKQVGKKLATACLMGGAVLSMHYTGMAAAVFVPQYNKVITASGLDNTWLAFIVCGFVFLTLVPMAAALLSDSLETRR